MSMDEMKPVAAEQHRVCRHCGVDIEMIDCADGRLRWMHRVDSGAPGIPSAIYLDCKPTTVAEPCREGWPVEVIRRAIVQSTGMTYTAAGKVSDDVMNALNGAGWLVVTQEDWLRELAPCPTCHAPEGLPCEDGCERADEG